MTIERSMAAGRRRALSIRAGRRGVAQIARWANMECLAQRTRRIVGAAFPRHSDLMRRALLAALLAMIVGLPALADQRDERLPGLFDRLKASPSDWEAKA